MDVMDGLEFIKNLRESYSGIRVIVISGYNDFEYARRSVELGVHAYLLKPLLPEELIEVIAKLASEIEEDEKLKLKLSLMDDIINKNREIIRNKLINDLINGNIYKEDLSANESFADYSFCCLKYLCAVLYDDDYKKRRLQEGIKAAEIALMSVIEIANDYFCKSYNLWSVINNEYIILILGCNDTNSSQMYKKIYKDMEKFKERLRVLTDYTCTISMGSVCDNILNINKSYLEALKLQDYRMAAGEDNIIQVKDAFWRSDRYIYPEEIEKRILSDMNKLDGGNVAKEIAHFFSVLANEGYPMNKIKMSIIQLYLSIIKQVGDQSSYPANIYSDQVVNFFSVLEKFDTLEDIKGWVTDTVNKMLLQISKERQSSLRNVIIKAQRFILDNMSDPDLSLTLIAENVYLNPGYFSKLYKKQTGESYIDFLINQRIGKAKKLLRETNYKIYDVGIQVGYPNVQYFCTLFKRSVGISPAEYREKRDESQEL